MPTRLTILSLFLGLSLIIMPGPAAATSAADLQTLQIFFENDLFGDTDKYYTNAVQATWLSGDLKQYRDDPRLPELSQALIQRLPFADAEDSIHNVGLILGQQIYTPADIQETTLITDDRPYAGFLYFGLALHSKTRDRLNTVELSLGIVGPDALGEWAQNTVHEIRDIPTAKGWDNQLHNEPTLGISWQRKQRLYDRHAANNMGVDLISHAGLTLGNVKIGVNAGAEVRFGYNIPMDFGSDVIRAGAGVSAPVTSAAHGARFGAHLFAGAQAEAVFRDIFLDGNTWQSSHSVDKEPVVADLSVGLALNWKTVKLTYRHLYRTRQFKNQKQDQVIGSLTLAYAF